MPDGERGHIQHSPADTPAARPTSFEPPVEPSSGTSDSQPGTSVITPEGTGKAFDERYREPFEGLNFLGRLEDQFDWLGHRFHIKTLTDDEILAVGIVTKEFNDTIGQTRAYATAWAALATVSVDGQELPSPYQETARNYEWAFERFNYVKARWYSYTTDFVYSQCMALENQVGDVIEAMGKASGSTVSTPGSNASSV